MLTAARYRPAAMMAAMLFAVTACGSEDGTASPTSAAGTSATSSPAVQTTTADPVDRYRQALLTRADLGPAFVEGTWEQADPSTPSPCGQPSVQATYPDAIRLGTRFAQGQQLQLIESVTVFADTATAQAAYTAGAEGLSCEQGLLGGPSGEQVMIGQPANVTDRVGGDRATRWNIRTATAQGLIIAAMADNAVVTFIFLAAAGSDSSNAPDPHELARTGVTRLVNA